MKVGNIDVYGFIYKITNKVNGKVYIGQTINGFDKRYIRKGIDIEKVYKTHKYNKENNRSYNEHLYNSIEKYGFDNFDVVKVLDVAFSKSELNIKEKCWVSIYDSFKNGYNQDLGGNCASNRGYQVIRLNDRKIFDSAYEVARLIGISESGVNVCCVHPNTKCSCGVMDDGEPMIWMYKKEYDNMSEDEIISFFNKQIDRTDYRVIRLNDNKIYENSKKVAEELGLKGTSLIDRVCLKGEGTAYKMQNGIEPCVWRYYKDIKRMNEKELSDLYDMVKKIIHNSDNRIICVNNGIVYNSSREVARKLHICRKGVLRCCNGLIDSYGKLEGEPIIWMFYRDFKSNNI